MSAAALLATPDDGREPLDVLLRRYRNANVAAGCRPSTVALRLKVLRLLAEHTGIPDPRDTTGDDVVDWLTAPRQGGQLSASSLSTYYASLAAFYRWAVDTDRMTRSPLRGVRRPKRPRGVPHPISEADLARALDAARAAGGHLEAWLLLGAYQGLRVHEMAQVRGEDFAGGVLRVDGKGGVTASLRVHPRVAELAERYPARGPWFPSTKHGRDHVHSNWVCMAVRDFLRELEIPATAHSLRHRYVTAVLKASGGNLLIAQQAARHASVAQTQGYAQIDPTDLGAAIEALP